MKRPLRMSLIITALLFVMLGAFGFLVLLSGVVPLGASSGHWRITRWVLQLGKERSVATHSLGLKPPDLEAAAQVFKGAGHFETGCRPCHGAPGTAQPRVAQAMLPKPPALSARVGAWAPEELFYIVKHGIKLTGMPAWPALQRDDEVWAMTAFLLELPELDAAGYRALVYGEPSGDAEDAAPIEELEPSAPLPLASSCARCHGERGEGRMPSSVPKLGGQREPYLVAALEAYASGQRHSGIMEPVAVGLTRAEIRALAAWYAGSVERGPAEDGAAADLTARGEEIALRGAPAEGVPPCHDCHRADARRNPMYPVLNGQYAEYLELQLELFERGQRGGSSYAHVMRHIASRLTPELRRAAAAYYASLPRAKVADASAAPFETPRTQGSSAPR